MTLLEHYALAVGAFYLGLPPFAVAALVIYLIMRKK